MTDREMIDEIVKLDIEESGSFYSAYINDMRISKNKPLSVSKTIMTFDCPKKYILEAIGIPEDAVVLTKEEKQEYENLIKLLIYDKPIKSRVYEFIKDVKERERKETAMEILGLYSLSDTFSSFQEKVAKQYGVNLEE